MKESLVCTACERTWKRERTRGRKPILCPTCSVPSEIKTPLKTSKASPRVAVPVSQIPQVVTSVEPENNKKLTLSKVIQSIHPKSKDAEELAESTKNGSTWKCPTCGYIITLYVSVSDIPTHRCTPDTVSVKFCERIK